VALEMAARARLGAAVAHAAARARSLGSAVVLEMAARAHSVQQWRSKWLLEPASEQQLNRLPLEPARSAPQWRSKWPLEPAQCCSSLLWSRIMLEMAARACLPRTHSRKVRS